MNKIYSDPIRKAMALSQGVKENAGLLQQHSISINTEKILSACKVLEEIAAKQEAAETTLKEIREKAHAALDELKNLYNQGKQPVKLNFPPEQWAKFGLPDKR